MVAIFKCKTPCHKTTADDPTEGCTLEEQVKSEADVDKTPSNHCWCGYGRGGKAKILYVETREA